MTIVTKYSLFKIHFLERKMFIKGLIIIFIIYLFNVLQNLPSIVAIFSLLSLQNIPSSLQNLPYTFKKV